MSNDKPTISIITPSFNQGLFLEETIQSVLRQDYPNLEYIIIDGGSTDDSVEIIKAYEHRLAFWVSEPDNGQAHALNKGFILATGSLLSWLNSDDLLLPNILPDVALTHASHPESILLGDVIHFDREGDFTIEMRQHNVTVENMIAYWNRDWLWNQPGTFIPKRVWDEIGVLDEGYRYIFDREWMCRALIDRTPLVYLGYSVAAFRLHSESKTVREYTRWGEEQLEVTKRYRAKVPGLSERDVAAEQGLMNASQRLSVQHLDLMDKRIASTHLRRAIRYRPRTLFSRNFWRLVLRLLIPKSVFNWIRPVWLKRRSAHNSWQVSDLT